MGGQACCAICAQKRIATLNKKGKKNEGEIDLKEETLVGETVEERVTVGGRGGELQQKYTPVVMLN